jgi:hypothetical protein
LSLKVLFEVVEIFVVGCTKTVEHDDGIGVDGGFAGVVVMDRYAIFSVDCLSAVMGEMRRKAVRATERIVETMMRLRMLFGCCWYCSGLGVNEPESSWRKARRSVSEDDLEVKSMGRGLKEDMLQERSEGY